MSPALLPLHLGQLHAYETILLVLLAFGPFVVLAFVVAAVRRRDLAEEAQDDEEAQDEVGAEALEARTRS